ncbi:MAG: hypothetical protein AAF624_09270, partial [Bacteroidota bacterium]
MLVLDKVNFIESGRIEVPFYHKGHLSLKSDTQVTVCLIPQTGESHFGSVPEMIVSPIKFNTWANSWRIEAVFREQQGVVHKLLSIIKDAELNILIEESSSVENRDLHQIELIVDASTVMSFSDGGENDIYKAIRDFERRVIALCIDELDFMNGSPRIKVSPLKGLRQAYLK